MILTALLLTSIFVASTALSSRGLLHCGLTAGNYNSTHGYARIVFNLVLQTALVLMLQFSLSLVVVNYANANELSTLAVGYSGVTFTVAVVFGIFGYVAGRKNVESVKKNLSTVVPTSGGIAPVMDVDIAWKDEHRMAPRIYDFFDKITAPSVLLCIVIGLWWGFTFR